MGDDARTNVLFIISDDLNTSLGCYGHPLVKSPNIDRLAARGMRFERAYCQYPLCGPSRNSMLTGLYPNSTGIHSNSQIFRQSIPQQYSLPQSFRLDGYFATRIGKLFHYQVPKSIGTNGHDDPGSWELELNPAGCDRLIEEPEIFTLRPGNFGGTLSWYASPRGDHEHTDGMMAADAEWVLERCARESRPFFLAVGFFRPHTPYVAPQDYFTHYPKKDMPLVQGVQDDIKDLPPDALASHKQEHDLLNDDLRQQAIQAYYASIEFMDAQVGHVLDALDRLGLAENTAIVFTSDHGYHLGEHGLWQKMSLFEESARVPLIIVPPNSKNAGTVCDSPVGLVDLAPTLLEICGVSPPDNLQGQSLVPMLENPNEIGRGWSITQVVRRHGRGTQTFGYSLRTPRWRYTEWDSGKRGRELYDHKVDPLEQTNLVELDTHANVITELAKTMKDALPTTLPKSGDIPQVSSMNWSPNLTEP
ncbi:MAG: sulfatase [Planctomycetaceae bacterium]|nr:sulfatase [Planctomycetaceae bacterium]